ncbi:MAG: hypothetical protein RL264_118 [Bacteroidota bacterium]|jgi:protein TonB
MELKKSLDANIEKVRSSLFMIGMNFVAGITLAAFSFQTNIDDGDLSQLAQTNSTNVYQQEEQQKETPPPPQNTPTVNVPPPVSEEIVIKDNTEEEPQSAVPVPPPVEIAEETVIAPVEEEIIEFPDVEATFPGGAKELNRYISGAIQYPATSIEMNEQGKVYLSFVVEADGSITNVSVERGVSADLDREAKRVVRSMPAWTPGEARGKKVRTRCRLPINFTLG